MKMALASKARRILGEPGSQEKKVFHGGKEH